MKAENDGPTITYGDFIEQLDEGDSFTTSLIDILVKVRLDLYLELCSKLQQRHALGSGRASQS